ncbi:uncharacterized protein LOC119331458 [Triticum dicoccoides]|uniref:uncharacterized protein LOC119331458 n=1 Tax=Triticum dicoccoides TaxID=85692 RepID=UPI001890EDDE|nr:uncharacterized protein LOC119331458 [Triticum dicoccoides]
MELRDWLDLSLNHAMPLSILIPSRAFIVSRRMKPEEAAVAILSSLPDEVVDIVFIVLPSKDSVSERRKKLEFLEMREELIKVMYMSCKYLKWTIFYFICKCNHDLVVDMKLTLVVLLVI